MKHHTWLRQLLAGVLLVTLVVPTFGPSMHELFEEHRHFHCDAVSEQHWHAEVAECDLCTYLMSLHSYPEAEVLFPNPPEQHYEMPARTVVFTHSSAYTLPCLRAPPVS